MAITRRITTSTEEPLYNEGDVLAKSTNGLPMYGMTEADMQALQAAPAAQAAQAQRTAEIVNAARNGGVSSAGGTVTYDGGQRGGVTVLPDIRGDGDGVWLANMAPGRPIDLGPTAGWAGFNGQGQFVGYPSGMPHVLYGGFMDTLAPFMQYLSPMFQQARANVAQAPAAPASPATPASPRRRADTGGATTVDVAPVTAGPVSNDITDNAWSIRTPATTWLEEAKRNITGIDPETGQPILDLESVKPTEDLIMTGPRGNVIRFTPETTQERLIQQYSVPQFDTSVDIPTMEIPDYTEPIIDNDRWREHAATGGMIDFSTPDELIASSPDVSPEDAANVLTTLSFLPFIGAGRWLGGAARAFSSGASALKNLMGIGKAAERAAANARNVGRLVQPNVTNAQRAANEARINALVGNKPAPTAVRTDVSVSTPSASPASLAERMRMAPPGSMPLPFQSPADMWRSSYWMPQINLSPAAQAAVRAQAPSVPLSAARGTGYGFQGQLGTPFVTAPQAPVTVVPRPGFTFQGQAPVRATSTTKTAPARKSTTAKKPAEKKTTTRKKKAD